MTDYLALLGERFPVRNTKAQRTAFRAWLREEVQALGYRYTEETNGFFHCSALTVGNPEKAPLVLAAHTDTPARWLLPDLSFPRNIPLWILWQLLHMVLLLIPALAVYLLVWRVSGENAQLGLWGLVLTYVGALLLSQFGPANPRNRGEDADLAAVLSLLAGLPEEDREKVAVVFADQGCRGVSGTKAWAKEHPQAAYTRLTLTLSRIGEGKSRLCASTASARKCTGWGTLQRLLGERLGAAFCDTRGFTLRGDRRGFRCGVTLTAGKHSKLLGLWSGRARTPQDVVADPENVTQVWQTIKVFLHSLKTAP